MARIALSVEQPANRRLLLEHLGVSHDIATDGGELAPDLVITDLPAYQRRRDAIAARKGSGDDPFLPVLLLVPHDTSVRLNRDLGRTIDEIVDTPVRPEVLDARVSNLLKLRFMSMEQHQQTAAASGYSRQLEEEVRAKTRKVQEALADTVQTLTRAAEYRDVETGVHIQRVGYYSRLVADRLGLDEGFRETVFYAAPMHDMGKIAVPDQILLKPGRLEGEEVPVMNNHTVWGEQILQSGNSPYLQMGAEIARSHHERWDGTGYPDGLAGEAIPLSARIMSLADVYDALRSRRPYKPPFDHPTAVRIILEGDDRTDPAHFDPEVLAAFRRGAEDFAAIFDSMQDDPEAQA